MASDHPPDQRPTAAKSKTWLDRTVIGIVLATFFSDVSHEMCTAVLPLFLAAVGLGPAALGMMEGTADLLMSISKLGGGLLGHYVPRKRPWAALGYLVTTLATGSMGLVRAAAALVSLRSLAWIGRGFRSPLRDYLLADAVARTHYGRAYGLERAGDMLGAVAGPLVAAVLVWAGVDLSLVILWTLLPGLLAAGSMFFVTRERTDVTAAGAKTPRPEDAKRQATEQADPGPAPTSGPDAAPAPQGRRRFPRAFWWFLAGVFLFGLGDFSRTFLIWLARDALGETAGDGAGLFSVAILLYTVHNLVSALAAYPVGHLGDRRPKLGVLNAGYALGVVTNLILAIFAGSLMWLTAAIVLSGVYIAVEETMEKAAAAALLPRHLRSLGFGILACVNAVGDMASSLYVGLLLGAGRPGLAFGTAAGLGAAGVLWMLAMAGRMQAAERAN